MKIDLSKELNKTAENLVDDTIDGIKKGSHDRKRFKPNSPSTIKKKGHGKPLMGKNKNGKWLKKNNYDITKATASNQKVSVTIPDADIAEINQTSKDHPREFWGMSKKVEDQMNKDVNKGINKDIDNELIKMGFKKV